MSEKPVLLWDAGPGEIRTGLVEGGKLCEFRIIRPRHPEKALYQAGENYTARIIERSGRTALVSLGVQQALLDPAPAGYNAGQLVSVVMTRNSIAEPGRWKQAKVRLASDPTPQHKEPAWHFSGEPWELFLRKVAPTVSTILCAEPMAASAVQCKLGNLALLVRVDRNAIAEADFDSLIETAVSGQVALPSGVQLSVERTRAMTVIDVDGYGNAAPLNRAAASHIAHLLRLLDIGGPIAIDFIAMEDRGERLAVANAFDAAAVSLGHHERTAINGFGLMQIIRPRHTPSVPEILCTTTPGRLSLESRAIALLRDAQRSQGIGPRHLIAPPAIIELIRQSPWETLALSHICGAEIVLVPDPAAIGYGHVHVAQS